MTQDEINEVLIGSAVIQGVGVKKLFEIYNYLTNSEDKNKSLDNIIDKGRENYVERNKSIQKLGLSIKTIASKDYPENLRQIADPPAIIYYKGNWDSAMFKNCFTIVGTRSPSDYGKRVARKFSKEIGQSGFTIVSGLAFGIDRESHLGAIDSNSKTIAVQAGSPHKASPSSNFDVYKMILDSNGIILSDVDPFAKLIPGLFASRNRIVAGLSMGTLVIEAGKKSGSLITADLAMQYNREVFAIPADLDKESFWGSNEIIKNGSAKLVQTVQDILLELGFSVPKYLNVDITSKLSENEKLVLNFLQRNEAFAVDISKSLNLDLANLAIILTKLEIKGFIKKSMSGKYILK